MIFNVERANTQKMLHVKKKMALFSLLQSKLIFGWTHAIHRVGPGANYLVDLFFEASFHAIRSN